MVVFYSSFTMVRKRECVLRVPPYINAPGAQCMLMEQKVYITE